MRSTRCPAPDSPEGKGRMATEARRTLEEARLAFLQGTMAKAADLLPDFARAHDLPSRVQGMANMLRRWHALRGALPGRQRALREAYRGTRSAGSGLPGRV